MTAMTSARTPRQWNVDPVAAHFGSVPVAAGIKIWAGALVFLLASGYASDTPAATALCLGIAPATVDNTDGLDGALSITPQRGCFGLVNSGGGDVLAAADIGKRVYAVDDQTVAKTSNSGTRCVAGTMVAIESGVIYVEVGLDPSEGLAIDAVLDATLVHRAGAETITGVKTFAAGADPVLAREAAHTLAVAASTTEDTAGGALAIRAGDGGATNADGGALTLDAGAKAGSGTDGVCNVGTTNAESVSVGRTGKTTTVNGALAVTQASTLTGNVGVGGAPAASAALTVTSTTQGLLFPRMTEAERDAISAPAAGLVVYNTTTNKLNLRVAAAWEVITSS